MKEAPNPIIILGTGRSFTSVITCMIGEHPDLIGLPETNIFSDPTIGDVLRRFERRASRFRRSGLLRTLAEFHSGAQTEKAVAEAEQFLLERLDWSYRDIASYLAELIAPRRIVEKSISTCRNEETLARVIDAWPRAHFIHVTRQPEAIVASMNKRIDSVIEGGNPKKGQRLQRWIETKGADNYYVRMTSLILEFMRTLAPGQGINLRGEDFLTDAPTYLRQICNWIGIDDSDASIRAMLHPEKNPFAHPGPEGAHMGFSSTFLKNPHYSGDPVVPPPMSIRADDPSLADDMRLLALLGNRLGYT